MKLVSSLVLFAMVTADAHGGTAPPKRGFGAKLVKRVKLKQKVNLVDNLRLRKSKGRVWLRLDKKQEVELIPKGEGTAASTATASSAVASDAWIAGWRGSESDEPLPAGVPADVDFSAKVPPVVHQGTRPTCWANAIMNWWGAHHRLWMNSDFLPSRENMIEWAHAGEPIEQRCDPTKGSTNERTVTSVAIENMAKTGASFCDERAFAYGSTCQLRPIPEACASGPQYLIVNKVDFLANETSSYDPRNTRLIENFLRSNRDVLLGVEYAGDWGGSSPAKSMIDVRVEADGSPEKPHARHVINVVGYHHDQDPAKSYFIIQNSWGTGWGRKGFARLSYDYVESYAFYGAVISTVTPKSK